MDIDTTKTAALERPQVTTSNKQRGHRPNSDLKKNRNKREHDPSSHSKRKRRKHEQPTAAADLFPHVTDPQKAARVAKRQADIDKGKNTAGYEAYRLQVPLASRQLRSMDTPATPQPTWDVSVKRWQGMVRAWRKALHRYDPPEMQTVAVPMVQDEEFSPVSMKDDRSALFESSSTPVRVLDFAEVAEDSSDDDDDLL